LGFCNIVLTLSLKFGSFSLWLKQCVEMDTLYASHISPFLSSTITRGKERMLSELISSWWNTLINVFLLLEMLTVFIMKPGWGKMWPSGSFDSNSLLSLVIFVGSFSSIESSFSSAGHKRKQKNHHMSFVPQQKEVELQLLLFERDGLDWGGWDGSATWPLLADGPQPIVKNNSTQFEKPKTFAKKKTGRLTFIHYSLLSIPTL